MNKTFFLMLSLCALFTSSHASLSSVTSNTSTQLWSNTVLPHSPDPGQQVSNMLCTLPGMPATSTLFFTRTPNVVNIQDVLATKEPFFDGYREHLSHASIQEHTVGLQLGQSWRQDQWEFSWDWWCGVRERNLWMPQLQRRALREKLKKHDEAGARITNLWNAAHMQVGVGDVHIAGRYYLPIGSLLSLSLGVHTVIPTATKQQQSKKDAKETTPTETSEIIQQLTRRSRDILLCAPFGSDGHTGIGVSGAVRINLGDRLQVVGELTSIRFRPGTQIRYALAPSAYVIQEKSSAEEEMTFLVKEQTPESCFNGYFYPQKNEVTLVPGAHHTAHLHLTYTTDDIHCAVGYERDIRDIEESESAPFGTLRMTRSKHDALIGTASMNTHHGWGDTSSYVTARYALNGGQEGSWMIGFGATVQA